MCNVIKSMGCSRELTGKKLEGQQERLHCQHIHLHRNSYIRVKINQHMLSLRIDPIWLAIDPEDDSSSADAYRLLNSVFDVGGMRVDACLYM